MDTFTKTSRAAAEHGVADMQTMSVAMGAFKESSDDVAKIIKTIDEIAFQTNILARRRPLFGVTPGRFFPIIGQYLEAFGPVLPTESPGHHHYAHTARRPVTPPR